MGIGDSVEPMAKGALCSQGSVFQTAVVAEESLVVVMPRSEEVRVSVLPEGGTPLCSNCPLALRGDFPQAGEG